MIKYYFVTSDGTLFINLPLSVSRSTIKSIALDLSASSVFYTVHGVNIILDL